MARFTRQLDGALRPSLPKFILRHHKQYRLWAGPAQPRLIVPPPKEILGRLVDNPDNANVVVSDMIGVGLTHE